MRHELIRSLTPLSQFLFFLSEASLRTQTIGSNVSELGRRKAPKWYQRRKCKYWNRIWLFEWFNRLDMQIAKGKVVDSSANLLEKFEVVNYDTATYLHLLIAQLGTFFLGVGLRSAALKSAIKCVRIVTQSNGNRHYLITFTWKEMIFAGFI